MAKKKQVELPEEAMSFAVSVAQDIEEADFPYSVFIGPLPDGGREDWCSEFGEGIASSLSSLTPFAYSFNSETCTIEAEI